MKRVFFFSLFLLFILVPGLVIAEKQVYVARGYVTIKIINNPPEITGMEFSPETPYADSVLGCRPVVRDEVPDQIVLYYKWYKNGGFVGGGKGNSTLSGFSGGDIVTCEAIAEDTANQRSEPLTGSITISKTPLVTRVELFVMNMAGIRTDTNDMLKLERQGIPSITGYMVREVRSDKSGSYSTLLGAIVLLLLLVDLNIFVRHILNKSKAV